MNFVTLEEVLVIHDKMLEIGGGKGGVHDFSLLHSATERPKAKFGGKFLYTSIWQMAAAMLHSLIKNHPFEDGNKRTAYFSTMRFLHKNGYKLLAKDKAILDFTVKIDTENTSLEDIASWIQKNSKKVK